MVEFIDLTIAGRKECPCKIAKLLVVAIGAALCGVVIFLVLVGATGQIWR